jgi:hypothetical protein
MVSDHIGETSRVYPTKLHGAQLAHQAGDVAAFVLLPFVCRRAVLPGVYLADGRQVS